MPPPHSNSCGKLGNRATVGIQSPNTGIGHSVAKDLFILLKENTFKISWKVLACFSVAGIT